MTFDDPNARTRPAGIRHSNEDDLRLVQGARRGAVTAFEALYRRHVARVHGLCCRLTGDRAEAEDLTQEVFLRAWQKLGTFREKGAFGAWLRRLAVNVVLEHGRTAARRRRRTEPGDGPAGVPVLPAETRSVDVAIDLDRAIRRLPAGARTVFVLHDVEGWRHREIAELTGTAVGTVKAQLHRARALLREFLGSSEG